MLSIVECTVCLSTECVNNKNMDSDDKDNELYSYFIYFLNKESASTNK